MKLLRINITLIFSVIVIACSQGDENTISIGKKVLMVKNLNVNAFRNGDIIPEAKTDDEWTKAAEKNQPAWCYYNNDPKNGEKYGKLYNWYAVNDPRGIAPQGYHVLNLLERDMIVYLFGGDQKAGNKLKNSQGWAKEGNGSNESEFSALPGGFRDSDGYFLSVNGNATFWTSDVDEYDPGNAWYFDLGITDYVSRHTSNKGSGFSVRCLKE